MTNSQITGLRVLVVEDEALCAMMIADEVEDLGCQVVGPAASVRQALGLIDRRPIDVAILDLHLGRGDTSYPVADALLAHRIPFAFLTGIAAQVLPPPYCGWPFFRKPFPVDRFAAVLRDLATQRRQVA